MPHRSETLHTTCVTSSLLSHKQVVGMCGVYSTHEIKANPLLWDSRRRLAQSPLGSNRAGVGPRNSLVAYFSFPGIICVCVCACVAIIRLIPSLFTGSWRCSHLHETLPQTSSDSFQEQCKMVRVSIPPHYSRYIDLLSGTSCLTSYLQRVFGSAHDFNIEVIATSPASNGSQMGVLTLTVCSTPMTFGILKAPSHSQR